MNSEDFVPRPRPPSPYAYNGRVLQVSRHLLDATFDAFKQYAQRKVEACCFWYGVLETSGNAAVAGLLIPAQTNRWGSFSIRANTMAKASAATQPHGWRNLAQIHTHPGTHVEHSLYDDGNVNSRQALSLVLPVYGIPTGTWPRGVGIHEFQNNYWHLLSDGDAAKRLKVSGDRRPVVLDIR